MTHRQTQINIPERREDEPPASADQLQRIRQLATGRSLQGYRFDYRKLGSNQATSILNQLQAMNDQTTPTPKPAKQGPGCVASLAKGTTALIVWAIVIAGVTGGGYLIYNHIQNNPKPTASNENPDADPQDNPSTTNDRNDNPTRSTGSTIFEGLGVSDTPTPPNAPTPNTTDRTTDTPKPSPEPTLPPAPTVDRDLINQLASLEEMLVKLSQYTRSDFAVSIRDQSSQAMQKKLDEYPKALAALDAADPTLSARIRAVIDAFAAPTVDGPALREDIKAIRDRIDKLQ